MNLEALKIETNQDILDEGLRLSSNNVTVTEVKGALRNISCYTMFAGDEVAAFRG